MSHVQADTSLQRCSPRISGETSDVLRVFLVRLAMQNAACRIAGWKTDTVAVYIHDETGTWRSWLDALAFGSLLTNIRRRSFKFSGCLI